MVKKLSGGRMKPADYTIPRHAARVPVGTTLNDILAPEYFLNYAGKMEEGAEISVVADDYSLDVRVRALQVSPIRIVLRVLDVYAKPDEDGDATTAVEGIQVKYRGRAQWSILKDGEVIQDKITTKEEAQELSEVLAEG